MAQKILTFVKVDNYLLIVSIASKGYMPSTISEVSNKQSIPSKIVLYKSDISALIGLGMNLIVSRKVPEIKIGMPFYFKI